MRLIDRRIGLVFLVFLLALAGGGAKAAWLGVVRADDFRRQANTQQTAEITVPARRGSIEDRNGVELAVSEPAFSVAATPYLIRDPNRLAKELAGALRAPEAELLEKLTRKDTGFVYLARKVPASRTRVLRKIEGIDLVPEARRVYPRKFLASQLLGMVGTENTGLAGLEHAHDASLRGRDGRRALKKDAVGRAIEQKEIRKARPGSTLQLTIDARIQDRTEEVLAQVGERYRPVKGATAIVMDPRSSEVLAMANWPRVDANNVLGAPEWARQNRAIGIAYEPGSTFKAFPVAGALEDGKVKPDTTFQLGPTITVADREIGEAKGHVYGTQTTAGIIQKSSNVGTVRIGLMLGADRFDYWVRRFGFGKRTGVDLAGEEAGILLDRARYSGSSMGNLPIGQGLAVTPMQMISAYGALANGGILRAPRVVRSVGGRPTAVPKGHRVIEKKTADTMRKMLEGVIGPEGTANAAAITGYDLAGKTGTAEKPDPLTGGYSETKFVASFIGFAPARNPKLLVLVIVDEPQGEQFGGVIAAPAWKDIMSFSLNYLKIPPK